MPLKMETQFNWDRGRKASDLSTATLPIEKVGDITGSFSMFRGDLLNDFQQGMAGFLDSLAQG